ncbi:hypothetical protein [Phenylobacterium immobile]|uniref:hypothetical protein n=1 Tax=Phenylobacterium immobile TaxID=21 RepID=UPI000B0E39AC|nr:hypothetical protein [Phenylobacterium immobile]
MDEYADTHAPQVAAPKPPTKVYLPDEASPLELRGIDGAQLFNSDKSPMVIYLLGEDSDIAVATRNSQTNRRIQAGQRVKITAEGMHTDNASYLAKLTTGWKMELGSDTAEFSQQAAAALYSDPKMSFVREQVVAFIEDRSNFLKG